MFTPDSSRIYSIVPVKDTAEDCVKIQELCLPYDGCRFGRVGSAFFSSEVISEVIKDTEVTLNEQRHLHFITKCMTNEKVTLGFFCVDGDVVGYGCMIERIRNLGIVIRYDLKGTGLASFFAERFMVRYEDKIAEFGKPNGALYRLAMTRKEKMQNNIQQATAL